MSEHDEQAMLIQWADAASGRYPDLSLLYAVPNGGHRHPAVAGKLKAEGVRRGVPDLCLPVPRGTFHGLYVELKAKGGRVKPEQKAWLHALQSQGYAAHLCIGWEDARAVIESYLTLTPSVAA